MMILDFKSCVSICACTSEDVQFLKAQNIKKQFSERN